MRAPSSKWRDGRPGLPAGPRGKRELRTCPPYWRIGSKRLPGEEEVAQAPGGLVGQLFGDELAGRHGVALQPAGALGAPENEWRIEGADDAVLAPQHERVAGDLRAGGARGPVVLEIDRRRGTVVLAGGVDRVGAAEAPLVLGH